MAALMECSLLPDLLGAARPAEWAPLRQAAEARLETQGLPTTRDEDWKYLDLALLRETSFVPGALVEAELGDSVLSEVLGTRLVFVNGQFASHLSNTSALPPGVRMLRLASASQATCALPRLLVVLESGAKAQLIEEYLGEGQ